MTNRRFDVNFYLDHRIVHIDKDLCCNNTRLAVKYAIQFMPKDIEFDTVKVMLV